MSDSSARADVHAIEMLCYVDATSLVVLFPVCRYHDAAPVLSLACNVVWHLLFAPVPGFDECDEGEASSIPVGTVVLTANNVLEFMID